MANVTIFYGSSTGNTESAAQQIADGLSAHSVNIVDVSSASQSDFEAAESLILGTSTWGLGDIQDDWDGALSALKSANLSGKKVALFGLGDSGSYSDTFVDGMGDLYEAATAAGATVVGSTATSGYSHSASRAEVNGEFVGLALDDDSYSENDQRIADWTASITSQL